MRLKLLTMAAAGMLLLSGCNHKEKSTAKSPTAATATTSEKKSQALQKIFHLTGPDGAVTARITDKGVDFNVSEPVVLIDFFATWCPPCRATIPHLADLQKRYDKKLKIVGVLVESKFDAELKRFVKGFGINYFVANGRDNLPFAYRIMEMLHQPKDFSIPFMVMFVNGRYFRHYVGLVPEEMIESDIKLALKEVK